MTDEAANDEKETDDAPKPARDPVRQWTLRVIVLALVLLAGYLVADRITPMSSQARVHALVVPIAAEVSGSVTDVLVGNNQQVSAGEILFRLDRTQYELAAASAAANLESARQSTGASEAGIVAAVASVKSAEANLESAEQDAVRLRRIKAQDPGALSDRRLEYAEASLKVAQQQVIAAKANLEQARQNLGQEGDANSRIQQAMAALEQAQVNLDRTEVRAPSDGVVTDVRVDRGNFAGAGVPQLTFVSTSRIWVQADFTENNLGHVDTGDKVEVLFDVYPGRVFEGTVRAVGYGVAVDSVPLGSLPTVDNNRQWLRSAQRFPVVVEFEMDRDDLAQVRVGAQASVIVYASNSWIFNTLGKLYIRVNSLLSYAY
jgi:multidrug resistance efflux pump